MLNEKDLSAVELQSSFVPSFLYISFFLWLKEGEYET